MRDANGNLVASDTTGNGSPKWLTAPSGAGGTYRAAVVVYEGATAYTLEVNPKEQAPAPAADNAGSPAMLSAVATTTGRWSVAVKINDGSTDYNVLVDTD